MPRRPPPPDPVTSWSKRRVIAQRFIECIDAAQKEAHIMYGLPPIGIANADRAVRRALARGIRIRSLYPEERATSDTMKFLEPFMKAGERVRFGRYVPTRMAIFDGEVVMIALAVTDAPEFRALEIRHPEMVALAMSAFEHAWRDGWEYVPPARRTSRPARTI